MLQATGRLDLGGTRRARGFDETLARVSRDFARYGITRVADITGLDRLGIPVALACRPNARSLAVSQGKGLTLAAAKCSAVMEAIELYHAEHVDLPLRLATTAALERAARGGGAALADLDRLARARHSRFHPDRELLWVTARHLRDATACWLPFEVVHCSARVPAPTGSGCFQSTSNGLASGNTLDEAVVHALAELIERDAIALWELGSAADKAASRVDLASIASPAIRDLIARIDARGFVLRLFDATSDIGVATFLAELEDLEAQPGTPQRFFTGMGTHPLRDIAAMRAMTEAAQCRLTLISGSRDDLFRDEYRAGDDHSYAAMVAGHAAPPRDFATVPSLDGASFADDIDWMLDRLAARGLDQALLVDLSLPDTGIAVARVVVPGLEGPDDEAGYAPGARARAVRGAGR